MKKLILNLLLIFILAGAANPSAEAAANVGDRLGARSFELLGGGTVSLPLEGKKACVINLWASWCPPCRGEMPQLQAFYDKHKNDPEIALYLINHAEPAKSVEEFMQRNNLTLPVLLDLRGEAVDMLFTSAIPTTVITDAGGKIIFRKIGAVTAAELDAALAKL
ncbi:MAG: TlpA family protein disulfide reductase [Acidaminococcales bacterium]|jgi:thiol-disulfide isomerase/thioredoxin|nr:TlpA family protein disulfide reductase [Acidaminococcales bacterium]